MAAGLGFRAQGLGFRVWGLGLRVEGLGFRAVFHTTIGSVSGTLKGSIGSSRYLGSGALRGLV